MAFDKLPPRNKSRRLIEKKQKQNVEEKENAKYIVKTISNAQPSDICLGLNEMTDSLNAFPQSIISYLTLLKEIEAKCVYTAPHLKAYIKRFLTMRKDHPKRGLLLTRIRDCIKELMPCLEEKMHVATIASDQVRKYIKKMDQSFEIIINNEIPEIIRIGPMWEPCMKVSEPKTAQQQRSESRREALAAKKAKTGTGTEDDYENTAAEDSSGPSRKSTKGRKESRNQQNTYNSTNTTTNTAIVNGAASKKRKGGVDDEYNNYNSNGKNGNINNGNINGSNGQSTKKAKAKKETRRDVSGTNGNNGNVLVNNINNNINNENSRMGRGRNGSGTSDHSDHGTRGSKIKKEIEKEVPTSPSNFDGEPVYCYCQQVSYGEMVGCDGEHCEKEWFHLPCTGLKELPKGEWYCDDCKAKMGMA